MKKNVYYSDEMKLKVIKGRGEVIRCSHHPRFHRGLFNFKPFGLFVQLSNCPTVQLFSLLPLKVHSFLILLRPLFGN